MCSLLIKPFVHRWLIYYIYFWMSWQLFLITCCHLCHRCLIMPFELSRTVVIYARKVRNVCHLCCASIIMTDFEVNDIIRDCFYIQIVKPHCTKGKVLTYILGVLYWNYLIRFINLAHLLSTWNRKKKLNYNMWNVLLVNV